MSLYRVTTDKLEAVQRTTFQAESLLERRDLQRLLRNDISIIGADLMVIAEEYGDWEDSNRRIDLLCLSKDASLVVVEIKRTQDGGHMELQALRYAAMVSSMTLDQAIHAYASLHGGNQDSARRDILEFLQLDSEDETELTGDVRIVLVSADFSAEITTTVLWLNRYDLDITCIRLLPYRVNSELLIDVSQIIPLPEAKKYEIQIREQEKEKRRAHGIRQDILSKFWAQLIETSKTRTQLLANRSATTDHWLSAGIGRSGFTLTISLAAESNRVECYISLASGAEKSKAAFASLANRKLEIERNFGGPLSWEELPSRNGCRICLQSAGGWRSPEEEWPTLQGKLIDALIRLENALKKPIQELNA